MEPVFKASITKIEALTGPDGAVLELPMVVSLSTSIQNMDTTQIKDPVLRHTWDVTKKFLKSMKDPLLESIMWETGITKEDMETERMDKLTMLQHKEEAIKKLNQMVTIRALDFPELLGETQGVSKDELWFLSALSNQL